MNKINIPYNRLKKVCQKVARNAFLIILCLILACLAFGGWMFYYYVILTLQEEIQIAESEASFNDKSYQNILDKWQEKELLFESFNHEDYQNPFLP